MRARAPALGLRFFCGGGGGSQKYTVASLGAHAPSKNPPPISGCEHTSLIIFLVVTFYELRLYGVYEGRLP
jgi:hypothetical protein